MSTHAILLEPPRYSITLRWYKNGTPIVIYRKHCVCVCLCFCVCACTFALDIWASRFRIRRLEHPNQKIKIPYRPENGFLSDYKSFLFGASQIHVIVVKDPSRLNTPSLKHTLCSSSSSSRSIRISVTSLRNLHSTVSKYMREEHTLSKRFLFKFTHRFFS